MKKKIYVGCYNRNIRSNRVGSYTYNYLPITVFIETARKEGLEIYRYQDVNLIEMWQCNRVYEIIFKYKFKERKQFREKLTNVELQPTIVKWFRVMERVD